MSFPPQDLALVLALCAGGGNAVGGLLVTRALPGERALRRSGTLLAALTQVGAGILIAVALLEFVPTTLETMRPRGWAAPLILLGYLLVHLVEHTIMPHFHGETASGKHGEDVSGKAEGPRAHTRVTSYSVVTALMVHSFFDGVAIGAAALLSPSFGWLTFAAILMHKVPIGATIASVMLSAGAGRGAAAGGSALVGSATVLGALLVRPLHAAQLGAAVGLGAGVMLYVAATELIPAGETQKKGWASVYVFSGVLLFVVTDFLVRKAGLQ